MAENSGQEQRAFWAVLLAMAVLLLWSVLFPAKPPPDDVAGGTDPASQPIESVGLQESGGVRETGGGPGAPDVGGDARTLGAGDLATGDGATRDGAASDESATSLLGSLSGTPAVLEPPTASDGPMRETVRVETEDLTLVFDGKGARLVEAHLHAYEEEQGTHVQLLPEGGPGSLGSVVAIGETEMPLDRFTFRLVSNARSASGREVTWELPLDEVTVRKTFTIPDDGYRFRVSHELVSDRVGVSAWGLSWAGGLRQTETSSGAPSRGDYFQGAVHAEGKVQRKGVGKVANGPMEFPGTTFFVTSQNKYFMAAIVPAGDAQGPAKLWAVRAPGQETPSMGAEILVERGSAGLGADRVDYDVYVGPQKYAEIKTLGLGIENAMDLGMKWVQPLSRFVLSILIAIRGFIPNYGFVIILFSALVNLLFFPLTYKSTKSMRDMSALKPRLDALKVKYKDEPQKMSEATMKLYKEAGVNPLGGCLPILLQMPIFFALYAVLFRTIELRQEPFIFWIRDLAQPDVIFHLPFSLPLIGSGVCLLPIIMGITSFFQSKMTMTDPNQKAMIYMMPVMMTVIFFTFPSGLVLYWLTSNLFTISTKFFMKPNPVVTEATS